MDEDLARVFSRFLTERSNEVDLNLLNNTLILSGQINLTEAETDLLAEVIG